MSDRISAEIRIGGPIPRMLVDDLCGEIQSAGVGLEWGESCFSPENETDLLDACDDNGHLVLRDDEARYGEFAELEAFLIKNDLSFDRHTAAKYDYDGELVHHRSGLGLVTFRACQDGKPLVLLEEVEAIKAALLAGDREKALTLIDEAAPDVPDLPLLTFVD